jgi:hypothetical protein
VKTLPKNLIRPLPVQDLEDLIADAPMRSGRRELKGDSAMKRDESELGYGDDLEAGCRAPFRRGERARTRVWLSTLSPLIHDLVSECGFHI